MVAIDLLMSDDRSILIPEGSQNVDLASKIQLYGMDVEKTLARYKEVVIFG
jgi:transcription antitermination factor NusA-like protein